MEVKTKFNLGDEFYYLYTDSTPIFHKCRSCKGIGKFLGACATPMNKNKKIHVSCIKCNGDGRIFKGYRKHIKINTDKLIITQIKINWEWAKTRPKKKPTIQYYYGFTKWGGDLRSFLSESDYATIFKTKKEAQQECVRRNKLKKV